MGRRQVKGQPKTAYRVKKINVLKSNGYIQRSGWEEASDEVKGGYGRR